MSLPIFSSADAVSPYRSYKIRSHLWVHAGSVMMPLAYKAATSGAAVAAARVLQVAQPTSIVSIEWQGTRQGDKPQPPIVSVPGSFTLADAGASVESVAIGDDGREIVRASGWFVLYTTVQPNVIALPSILAPWDGRYGNGSIDAAYLYSPADLGFGNLLPGQSQIPQIKAPFYGNPPVQQQQKGMLIL